MGPFATIRRLLMSSLFRISSLVTGGSIVPPPYSAAFFSYFALSWNAHEVIVVCSFVSTFLSMATEEDIAWFKSTFHPIPKPQLPDDSVEYFIYHLPSPAPAVIDEATETRARLQEVQRSAADLTKELLKDYIWQRESFKLEIAKDDGKELHLCISAPSLSGN